MNRTTSYIRTRKGLKLQVRKDPTRTVTLRRMLAKTFRKGFNALEREVVYLLVQENALGLNLREAVLNTDQSVLNTRWAGLPDSQKAKAFEEWLEQRINAQILETRDFVDSIEKAYVKGASRSYRDVNRGEIYTAPSPELFRGAELEFFRSNLPTILIEEKVKVLSDRVFTELKGVTNAMAVQIRRELVDGLLRGSSPKEIAARISDRIHKIGITRAELIARTEIVRVHAEGQLNAMEQLNVEEVTIMMEWVALYNACPVCQAQAISGPYTLDDAHGLIPFHAGCLCAWFPYRVRRRG